MLQPYLMTTDETVVSALADVSDPHRLPSRVIVDWERRGKSYRQRNAYARIQTGTQISGDTTDDLRRVKSVLSIPVTCRINPVGASTPREVAEAIECGADEILVPMVRTPSDVEVVAELAGADTGVAIMVETVDAVAAAASLVQLPLAFVYIGLMDLAIERGTPSVFTAVLDGTVEKVVEGFAGTCPIGFGGLTVPGRGSPVPTELFAGEMVRLGCDLSVLRRSFLTDLRGEHPGDAILRIRTGLEDLGARTDQEVGRDHRRLLDVIRSLEAEGAP